MGANVEHQFQKHFLLNEERLWKIKDILEARFKEYNYSEPLAYKITRNDSYKYDTHDVEKIIKESNESWKRIIQLEIYMNSKFNDLNFKLNFSNRGVSVDIDGNNRDQVLLISSDIKSYIENDVANKLSPLQVENYSLLLFYPLFIISFIIYILLDRIGSRSSIKAILASDDYEAKLNYLISRTVDFTDLLFLTLLLSVVFIPILFSLFLRYTISFFWPANEFLFGKRIDWYRRRKSLAGKIWWGCIVAFFVAIIAGVVVPFLARFF